LKEKMIKVGIIGGAGYTGGELLRILIHHPQVHIEFVHSRSQAGKPVYFTHNDLLGDTSLVFTDKLSPESPVDVLFLCSGHGESKKFLSENPWAKSLKIIDLSTDYRDQSEGFVYGLPELQRDRIATASHVANPGCFATAIQLGLLPLAASKQLREAVHVSAITGSTGAGQSLSTTSHFSWRSSNISIYKAFNHQHLKEIKQSLVSLQSDFSQPVNFIPYRGNFTRGIMANMYTRFRGSIADAQNLYGEFYQDHPFTHMSQQELDVKQVMNTNKCLIHLAIHDGNLLITSIIDNLTKGASGQAVQNMNLVFGLPETMGLGLKSVGF
jgi:N-acetyl-gamma-glutamyl-phosphate reductase